MWHTASGRGAMPKELDGCRRFRQPDKSRLALPTICRGEIVAKDVIEYGHQNTLAVDVLRDPKLKKPIGQADLHHGSDYTPWEGFDVIGWPVTTIARGRVVYEQGKIVGHKGVGEVLS